MNRRHFSPKPWAATVATLSPPEPVPVPEIAPLHFARQAMATRFEVILPFGTPEALWLAEEALGVIDRVEDQLTVFRDHSEIEPITGMRPTGPCRLRIGCSRCYRFAEQITAATERAFDISTGCTSPGSRGFFRRQGRVPCAEDRAAVMERVGMHHVVLDIERCTVSFRQRGLEFNLGSIGKGYALDRAAERLRQEGVGSALLHGGHSSVYAVGHPPGDPRGWAAASGIPGGKSAACGDSRTRPGSGTSAATFQHLEYNGRKLGHILDPRTGWPAEGVANATVIAPTAAEADALATAFSSWVWKRLAPIVKSTRRSAPTSFWPRAATSPPFSLDLLASCRLRS